MTGTTVDMALVHIETHEQFEKINSDKIAEAEALAAEALRMANEAKRAAERLAEVKKTLAMFSKKLEKVEKIVVMESKPKDVEATAVEADKAVAAAKTQPKPESPVMKKSEDAPVEVVKEVEHPVEKEMPPPIEDDEEEFVPPPPPATPVVVAQKKVVTLAPVEVEEEVEKDILESALDEWGVDKMCGVDEETIARIQAEELGLPVPVVHKKKSTVAPKKSKSLSKVATPVARETVAPKVAPSTETQIVALDDDEGKDFLEKTLDSWGVDRLCGVDDVALGLRTSHREPVVTPPEPFENPTRITYTVVPALEIVHSESLKEQTSKVIRQQYHLPQKYYQRAPTNYDFADPFGVDHDDFVMCGRLADICEPDLDALEQPRTYVLTAARAPVPLPEPEKSILKKEHSESIKNVSFRETSQEDKKDP